MTPSAAALIAATRFGFIPRGGDLAAIAPDPRGWVLRQMSQPAPSAGWRSSHRGRHGGADLRGAARQARARGPQGLQPADARSLSRRDRRPHRRRRGERDAARRAADPVLEQSFHGVGAAPGGPWLRRRLRARGDPPACVRPLPRHAARRGEPPGDAALSRQRDLDRPRFARRACGRARGSTRISAARSSSCTRSASMAAIPRPMSRPWRASSPAGRWRGSTIPRRAISNSTTADARARHENPARQALCRGRATTRAWRRCATWRSIRRRRAISR